MKVLVQGSTCDLMNVALTGGAWPRVDSKVGGLLVSRSSTSNSSSNILIPDLIQTFGAVIITLCINQNTVIL